jgi:WD40 repeat protein
MYTFVNDVTKFARFAAKVMVQSTPHLYLSALPFAPLNSVFARHYRTNFPRTLSLESGAPINWPAHEVLIPQPSSSEVETFAFSPNGKFLASGSFDGTIGIWDVETGMAIVPLLQGHHGSHVWSVAFSPDGKRLASGSTDKTIRIWDAETGQALTPALQGHSGEVSSVVFHPNGKCIASGSFDKTIRFWNAETGKTLGQPLQGHANWVRSIAFSCDGKLFASGSSD